MQDLTAKVRSRGSCKYLFENVYLFSNNGHLHCLPGDLEFFYEFDSQFHYRGRNNFCSEIDYKCPIRQCDFNRTLLNRTCKVPIRHVFQYEHSVKGQKCPIRTISTHFEQSR